MPHIAIKDPTCCKDPKQQNKYIVLQIEKDAEDQILDVLEEELIGVDWLEVEGAEEVSARKHQQKNIREGAILSIWREWMEVGGIHRFGLSHA